MTEPLLLPAPERYKDWRVLSEGEKQGEATGEEVLVKERENRLCFVPIPKYGLFLEAFETVIVPPDYGNNGCGFGDIREFDPNCMDFETWAKAAIDRGLVLRAKMGEGFEGEGDIIKYASRFNWITVGYCIRNTHNNRHGNHISIPPHGLYKWTAITRAEYEQETAVKEEESEQVYEPWTVATFPKDRPVWVAHKDHVANGGKGLLMITSIDSSGVDVIDRLDDCEKPEIEAIRLSWDALFADFEQHNGSPCGTEVKRQAEGVE